MNLGKRTPTQNALTMLDYYEDKDKCGYSKPIQHIIITLRDTSRPLKLFQGWCRLTCYEREK